jgi:plasmid stabilization system protein ParE
MPRGDKSAYTDKQKRQATHIEESYESRGVPADEAAGRAWATVNKESGGGKLSGPDDRGSSAQVISISDGRSPLPSERNRLRVIYPMHDECC